MAATAERLTEIATRHQVFLERVKTGEANQFAAFLLEMDRELRARLGRAEMTDFARARAEALVLDIERTLAAIYGRFWNEMRGRLIDIAEYEAGFEARSLAQGTDGAYEPVLPGVEQVRAAVLAAPMSVRGADGGKLLESFVRDWSATEVKRVSGAIRQGFYEGATTSKILQAVRGTKANGYRDGILAISNRNAEAVVKTAVQHVASVARQETWKQNADIVHGVIWVSTLDSRTTPQCRSLDGRRFPVDSGPRPPIHVRCRSTTVADLGFSRKNAIRASKDGAVAANLTYYEWLKTQPAGFVREALGKSRAELFLRGGLTAERFAELNLGRDFKPLTLDQMRKLEPLAFTRAGL